MPIIDYTQQKAAQVNAVLQSFPEVTNTYATVNAMSHSGNNRVQVNASLVPKDERTRGLDALNRAMREQLQQVGGIKVTSVAAAAMAVSGGLKADYDIHQRQWFKWAATFIQWVYAKTLKRQWLGRFESTLKQPKSMVNVTINREAANDAGLFDWANRTSITTCCWPVTMWAPLKMTTGNNIDVNVRLNDDNRQTISQLQSMYLSSSRMDQNGQPMLVPLSQSGEF